MEKQSKLANVGRLKAPSLVITDCRSRLSFFSLPPSEAYARAAFGHTENHNKTSCLGRATHALARAEVNRDSRFDFDALNRTSISIHFD